MMKNGASPTLLHSIAQSAVWAAPALLFDEISLYVNEQGRCKKLRRGVCRYKSEQNTLGFERSVLGNRCCSLKCVAPLARAAGAQQLVAVVEYLI